MPHPYVTGATVKNGKIKFTVEVDESDANAYVEITGNATQPGGAFADIHAIAQVPATASGASVKPSVDVTGESLSLREFNENEDITVFVQVAYVWVTVLGPGAADGAVLPGTWANIKIVSEIKGQPYTPPAGN